MVHGNRTDDAACQNGHDRSIQNLLSDQTDLHADKYRSQGGGCLGGGQSECNPGLISCKPDQTSIDECRQPLGSDYCECKNRDYDPDIAAPCKHPDVHLHSHIEKKKRDKEG